MYFLKTAACTVTPVLCHHAPIQSILAAENALLLSGLYLQTDLPDAGKVVPKPHACSTCTAIFALSHMIAAFSVANGSAASVELSLGPALHWDAACSQPSGGPPLMLASALQAFLQLLLGAARALQSHRHL